MNGRIEVEAKVEKSILNNLVEMPDFVTEWFYTLRASNKTMFSCRDFLTKIKNYLKTINTNTKIISKDDITLQSVVQYVISTQTKISNGEQMKTSDSYQQGIWFAMNNFLNFMHKRNYIPENYMDLIAKPKNHDLERINQHRLLLTNQDFNNILAAVKQERKPFNRSRDLAIMLLFMTTGMRKTALSEINLEDVDFSKNSLTVIDKGEKTHLYYITEDFKPILNEWLEYRTSALKGNTEKALFISQQGKRIQGNSIYNLVEKYCSQALHYDVSPHKLRSGFCSIMYNETGDIEKVRRMVGHSNVSTTQRYIVTKNEEKKEAANIMHGLLNY